MLQILSLVIFSLLLSAASLKAKKTYIVKFKSPPKNIDNVLDNDSFYKFTDRMPAMAGDKSRDFKQTPEFIELDKYFIIKVEDNSDLLSMFGNNIESAGPNRIFHIDAEEIDDPDYLEQWNIPAVKANEAWETATGKDILVGVVDTGIEYLHPDLKNQLWVNPGEDINNNGKFDPWPFSQTIDGVTGDINYIDDDKNGYADDIIGYDFVDQDVMNLGDSKTQDYDPRDEHGHGTAVSGIIAAEKNNSYGICGVAYNAKIVTLRGLDATGNGETDDIAASIIYGAMIGVDVMNFSFGESFNTPLIHDAVKFARSRGCVIAASSGNSGWDEKHYPSDYDEVISVGAIDSDLERDYRSNYGSRLALMAPGTNVMSDNFIGGTKAYSGTSMAAPHVAAAAAMLLESKPGLGPEEVKGILQSSARDAGDKGWDLFYASGILDINSALNATGSTKFNILFPMDQANFNRDKVQSIPVVANIITPLFDTYQVFITEGENAKERLGSYPEDEKKWIPVSDKIDLQCVNDTVAVINTSELKDTVYTVRILVSLKNSNTIEQRVKIELSSAANPLKISALSFAYPIFNESRSLFITAQTNRISSYLLRYRPKSSADPYKIVNETDYRSNYHSILLTDPSAIGIEMEADAIAYLETGDSVFHNFEFTIPEKSFPTSGFDMKEYSAPPSYINNEVASLYGSGSEVFAVNDYSYGTWGYAKLYQFEDGEFKSKDSLYGSWIPNGIGDSNGDGIMEVLAYKGGKTALFQAEPGSSNPFSSIMFADTILQNFWAAGMKDIDGDGLEDIIAFNDTTFFIMTYKNGKYEYIPALVEYPYNLIGTFPGLAVGDFDNDGNIELCHGNIRGNLIIHEFKNGQFSVEKIDGSTITSGSQYLYSADIDGDGTPEIISANFGQNVLLPNNDGGKSLWLYRVIKYTDEDYKVIWDDLLYGVRGGFGYRNAALAGNLDSDPADEIIISAFPNIYVMEWDDEKNDMKPMWTFPNVFTNSALVYDFDKNGINEFGFTGIFNTENGNRTLMGFFEYEQFSDAPLAVAGLNGYAINASQAYLKWENVTGADRYDIYKLVNSGGQLYAELIDSSTTDEITISNLENYTQYRFVLKTIDSSMSQIESDWSDILNVYTHTPFRPVNIETVDSRKLILSYNGYLATRPVEPGLFSVTDDNISLIPESVQLLNDSALILTFHSKIPDGTYSLNAGSFPDYFGTPTEAVSLNFEMEEVVIPDEIFLLSLKVVTNNSLLLKYSEPPYKDQAKDINNYEINPFGSVANVDETNDPSEFVINLSSDTPVGPRGKEYTLTVSNISAESGRNITQGAGNTLGFVLSAENSGNAYLYPNPLDITKGDEAMFAGLPSRCRVVIMTIRGDVIREIEELDGNGGTEWDGKDKDGSKLKSGVYLFKVIEYLDDGSEKVSDFKKFAYIR